MHNPAEDDKELSALGQDGVLLVGAHHQYVSGLRWLRDSTNSPRLVTASYDGSVLLHDVAAGHTRVVSFDEEDDLSALGCLDSSTILTGDSLVRSGLDAHVLWGATLTCLNAFAGVKTG